MSYKIAIDSCGELLNEWKDDERIEAVPLTLMVGGESIIDDETFDQKDFLKKVAACPECPKSACPSPERYMKAYECEADHIYAVTLSSELSGSYNSAVLGKSLFLEDNPGKKIHVFNSRSASGGESLIAMKIVECEEKGLSFEKTKEIFEFGLDCHVCQHIYTKDTVYVFNLSESEAQRIQNQKVECVIMEENTIDFLIELDGIYDKIVDFLKDTPISKILYQNVDVPYLMSLEPQMKHIWEGECAVSYSSNRYMEFNKLGVDKGAGLKHLAEILGIGIEETIAVGDNYNDMSMLQVAGLSVAAANAVDDVKKACDIVTKADNNQGVVAEVIERFIL